MTNDTHITPEQLAMHHHFLDLDVTAHYVDEDEQARYDNARKELA